MDYSPWSSKNLIDRNWLKKIMQIDTDVTCMYTNFGGRRPSGFGDNISYFHLLLSLSLKVNSSLTFYTITSTLSISRTETGDSARIECVAVSPSSSLDDISIESDNTQLTVIGEHKTF